MHLINGSREPCGPRLGAGRHRSAIAFCHEAPGAIALVVSQDGATSLFHRRQGEALVEGNEVSPDAFLSFGEAQRPASQQRPPS